MSCIPPVRLTQRLLLPLDVLRLALRLGPLLIPRLALLQHRPSMDLLPLEVRRQLLVVPPPRLGLGGIPGEEVGPEPPPGLDEVLLLLPPERPPECLEHHLVLEVEEGVPAGGRSGGRGGRGRRDMEERRRWFRYIRTRHLYTATDKHRVPNTLKDVSSRCLFPAVQHVRRSLVRARFRRSLSLSL